MGPTRGMLEGHLTEHPKPKFQLPKLIRGGIGNFQKMVKTSIFHVFNDFSILQFWGKWIKNFEIFGFKGYLVPLIFDITRRLHFEHLWWG